MKFFIGLLIILFGIFLGLWLGLYVLLWGGVLTIIEAVKIGSFLTFIWGVIKFGLAGVVGWGSFLLVSSIGVGIMNS